MNRGVSQRQPFHGWSSLKYHIIFILINHMNTEHEWKIIFGQKLNFKYRTHFCIVEAIKTKIIFDTRVNLPFKTLPRTNKVTQPNWEYLIQIIAYYSKIKLLCKIRINLLLIIYFHCCISSGTSLFIFGKNKLVEEEWD